MQASSQSLNKVILPPLGEGEYDYVWAEGPLGFQFCRGALDMPVALVGPNTVLPREASRIEHGDTLIAVNNRLSRDHTFEEMASFLRTVRKPCVLRFSKGPKNGRRRSVPAGATVMHGPGRTPARVVLPPLKPGEYEVLWETGPLGISIRPHSCGMPMVNRITGKGSSPDLARVSPGDFMVCVNEKFTIDYPFKSILTILDTVSKPVILRLQVGERTFSAPGSQVSTVDLASREYNTGYIATKMSNRAPTERPIHALMEGEYEVTWRSEKLGLSLKRHTRSDTPVIGSFTAGRTADFLRNCEVGDELVCIHNNRTAEIGFTKSVHLLSTLPKPIVLRFQKRKHEAGSAIMEPFPKELDPPGIYRLLWTGGQLGFALEADKTSGCPVVIKVFESARYEERKRIAIMDSLVSVGDVHTSDYDLEKILQLLRSVRLPCLLRFKSNDSDKDTVFEFGSDTETVVDDDYQAWLLGDAKVPPRLPYAALSVSERMPVVKETQVVESERQSGQDLEEMESRDASGDIDVEERLTLSDKEEEQYDGPNSL